MKEYSVYIDFNTLVTSIEANNEEEAIEKVKDHFEIDNELRNEISIDYITLDVHQ